MTSERPSAAAEPRHLITVALEDYYQVGAFNQLVQRGEWYRFESRLEHGTRRTLELLDAHGVKATFFALGWVADRFPELVREVAQRGHEIASKGYYHRHIHQMSPVEFVEDLARARDALWRASGRDVMGYRVAGEWLRPEDLWVLDALVGEGYRYSSSLAPRFRQYAHEPWRRFAHMHRAPGGSLWEFPISSTLLFGNAVPVGGGNYFRQLPPWFVRSRARRLVNRADAPFVLYFHTWELDPSQPRITAARVHQRMRHYRNLGRMEERLEWFLRRWHFSSVADHLGLRQPESLNPPPLPEVPRITVATSPTMVADVDFEAPPVVERTEVTVVVPCHNEELILPYLANTLRSVERAMSDEYRLHFVFVDDGSTDGTRAALRSLFGGREGYTLTALSSNQGVAAAILHGIAQARTPIVCSIDCDCTYDPHELARMIALLSDDVAMVTASPYHPLGEVRNVPRWRLVLSLNLSRLYRLVLTNKLATYTSCFRVYRRAAVSGMQLDRTGFLGVAEMLCRLDLRGARIVEFPTKLEVRILGRSKLRVFRIIGGHLVLLARVAWLRVAGRRAWARVATQ